MNLKQLFNTAQQRPWLRFTLLGLVALVWLACPNQARASCGYYVIIGHPSLQTAAEQPGINPESMPQEHRQCPCEGPQCREQNRPMTPAPGMTVSLQDPMAVMASDRASGEINWSVALIDEFSFLSDPHVWRIDPPPRA